MTSVTIPNHVTNLGEYAFAGCGNLASVTIGTGVTSIGDWTFSNCRSLANVTLGTNTASIGASAFEGCFLHLTSISIPNSVTSIGSFAFSECYSLTNVIIGNSVTNIGDYAFNEFSYNILTGVYFLGNAPSVDSDILSGNNATTVYYLPGTTGWENFAQLTGLPTVLWLPQVQTSNASFGIQTNQFGFNITWASGRVVVVDACTDLNNPTWSPLQTNMLTGDSCYFGDPSWTNYPGRFYRLRSP
jgi:hypothetical protein